MEGAGAGCGPASGVARGVDLPRVLAVPDERVMQNDWTARWNNTYRQLPRACGLQPGQRVTVVERTEPRRQPQRKRVRPGPTDQVRD
jgi:hypothetical protein